MNAARIALCALVVVLIMTVITYIATSALAPIIAFAALYLLARRYTVAPLAALIDRLFARRPKAQRSTQLVRLTYR